MAASCQPCSAGLTHCHLRRIGSRASVSGIADVIHFGKTVTLIGRKKDVVDYFLSCATPRGSDYMSRIHARVIRTRTYELVDSSLSGVYVNDVRIRGRVVLQEGDTVTFGHPAWQSVTPGARARQPNSPFYFLFEHCHCSMDQMQSLQGEFPVLAAARASQEVSLGLEMKAVLPRKACAAPGALPACPALSEQNAHRGCCPPAVVSALTMPLPSAASVQPPLSSSPATDSLHLTSSLLEMPDDPRLGASPDSAQEGSVQLTSGILRSVSPEYAILEEERPVAAAPSSQGALETMCGSFQAGERGSPDPRLSPPSTKELGLSGSPCGQEIMMMEVHQSTGETAKCDTPCLSEQVQDTELMEEAASGGQVAAAGCSKESSIEEGTVEGHGELFVEKLLPEAVLGEAEWAADESITDNSFANQTDGLDTEMLELLSSSSGSRTPEDLLSGEEPGRASPTRLTIAEKVGSGAPNTTLPREIPSGCDTREADSQGSASGGEGEVEMSPPMNARWLAMECHLGPRDGGSVAPEMEGGITDDTSGDEICYAEVGTQTGDIKEREGGPVVAQPGGERDAPGTLGVLQHDGSTFNTHMAEETLLQQLPKASALDFPTHEVSSKEEFSGERAVTAVASFAVKLENSSSGNLLETCKADTTPAAPASFAGVALKKGIALEEPLEADRLEQPMDSEEKHFEACPSQRSETFTEGMWDEGGGSDTAAERELEHGRTERAEMDSTAEGPQPGAFRLDCEGETPEGEGAALRPALASLAVSPGGGEPDSLPGRESQAQEDLDRGGTPGGSEPEAQRGRSMAPALPPGAAAGEGDPEDQPERRLGQPSTALRVSSGGAGSHGGDAAHSSSTSAYGHARLLPTFRLPGDTLEEEGIHHSEDIFIDVPLSVQRSEGTEGGMLGCENSLLWPKQGDCEDAQDADRNDDVHARAQGWAVGAKPIEDAHEHHKTVAPEQNGTPAERQTHCHESYGVSSGCSTHLGFQEESPLPQDSQEPELRAGEPRGLENSPEPKPQGASAGKGPLSPDDLPMEGSAGEEVCETEMAVECLAPPRPGGCSEEVTVPEEGDGLEQSPKGPLCREEEEESRLSLGFSAAGSGAGSGSALPGSTARHLPRESPAVPVAAPESSSSDELNLHISDSEAEREENGSSQAHRVSGRQAIILQERDALISDSAAHLGEVAENSEACGKLTARGPREAARQETDKAASTLEQQDPSPCEPCCGLSSSTLALPQASIADMAVGEKSPPLGQAAAVAEELEDQAVEGTELVPLNLSRVSGKDLCPLESDAKLGTEVQAPGGGPGLPEEVGSELLEDCGLLDSRFARQPGGGTLEAGETHGERLQSETPTSVCAGKVDHAQKTGGKALLRLKPGTETRQPQENASQSEEGPGCGDESENSEYGRSPFPEEEEEEGCSSRKRPFGEDQGLGLLDSEHASRGPKRLCLLGSGSDLHSSAQLLTAPLDLERRQDQCGRTIEKFVEQYSNQITLHSDEKEEKNTDSIAQIVRTYFNRVPGPAEPVGEDLEAEMSALPHEVGISEETDCKSAARSEAERRSAGEERAPSLRLDAEPQVNRVKPWDPSLDEPGSSARAVSHSLGSHTQQPSQELAHDVPESVWKACLSEEEEFQSSINSVLKHSPSNAPGASPERQCVQEPCGKNMDLVFSDISNSSTETEHSELFPKPESRSSSGTGSGQLHEMLSEAAEVDWPSGGCCSPEPADMDWRKEDRSAPSDMRVSSSESVLTPKGEVLVEPGSHLDAVGENADAPVLQQADGTFDGEESHKAPDTEASEWVTSCTSDPVGETREDPDESTSKMQIEDGTFLRRSHEDPPSQELECKPSPPQPSDSTLWNDAVKVEPTRCPEWELSSEEGHASPSSTTPAAPASESVSCPTVADPWGEGSALPSSSLLPSVASCPGQTRACSQAENSWFPLNGSCSLGSVKQEGGVTAVDAGARRKHQSREDRSFLCPLPPRGPAGIADNPQRKGFGGSLERDLGRGGAGWTGQTDTSSAAQADAAPFLTVGVGVNQVPAGSPLVQGDAPVSVQSAGLPFVSHVFKEEAGHPCDPQIQSAGSSPCRPYPTACSPVVPILQKPRTAEASANQVPERTGGPVNFHDKDRRLLLHRLDEAEVSRQPDAVSVQSGDEHPMCVEAKEGRSSTPMVCPRASDPPPQGDPWPYGDGSVQNSSPSSADGAESSPGKHWASSERDVAFQLQECHSVLEEISQSLCAVEGIDDMHMEKWREQISELQKATKMPSTYIAVVGNTGAGKSSLLNALLEEEAVLPTSAMRACTAVVVEISRAVGGRPYEACVEFLSQDEWYKELKALLEDMKDKSGNLKKRCPDRKTEAGAAYSRVKAVYGRVDEVAKLEGIQEVTQHLGTVKNISAETAAEFRTNIEKFIDSRTDNLRDMKGGEFWPIVKSVKIRVAQAEVLRTGVVLVDLPGIRDSNAARDNAAKEYLKNCNAVWVVASITRAVDDKTAKELLNSNLRRQLFMDGQYGNLAFVCTKTDSFNITDIVRDLDLRDEIQPLEEELEELEHQRMEAEEEKGTLHLVLQPGQQRQGVDAPDPAWLQRQHDFLEKEFRISALQKQKDAKLRAISLVCVQARNRFSKRRIRMDFSSGLEELKRKGDDDECDDDGDEDMEDGDFATSDPGDLEEAKSQQEKLHVFTVSSTEYLKLCGKLLRDGPPQVFHDPKDTEIPALKNFAIETGLKNSVKATEKVVRDVARVISQIVNYLTNQRAEDISHQAQVQEILQRSLQDIPGLLQEAADDILPDIQYYFKVLIQRSLSRGTKKVKELCEDIVKGWGMPEGFPHATYHAACIRHGVYASPKCGPVDFNAHLAKPIHEAITATWSEVFSSKLEESFQRFTKAVLDKLKFFFQDLKRKLGEQSSLAEALRTLRLQQMEAVNARLCNFLLDQETHISNKQRTISRLLTPEIQAGMEPAYAACSQMSGPGYFQRMKDVMESYVRDNKDFIFDSATAKVQKKLHLLQQYIGGSFQSLVQELNKSLRMQFEPLLKPVQKNADIIPDLMNICAKVDKICKRSCVEYVLPNITQVEAGSLETETERQGNSPCFSALGTGIRLGAVPLPHVTAVQQSPYEAEKLQDVPAADGSSPPHLPQVISVVQQQPQRTQVNLQLYGKKRSGEALQPLLGKRPKSQATAHKAGPDHTGHPLPSFSWSTEGQRAPCGQSTASGSRPASGEGVPEDCRRNSGWLAGADQYRTPASELMASPGPAGAPIQAGEGIWAKCRDPNSKGQTAGSPKTQLPASGQEAPPLESTWWGCK